MPKYVTDNFGISYDEESSDEKNYGEEQIKHRDRVFLKDKFPCSSFWSSNIDTQNIKKY